MTNIRSFPFDTILNWYKTHGRHSLPWRQIYHTPIKERLYKIWIAEVMLQQTQVERVIGFYTRFLKKYPTIEDLAHTTYDELFPYYQWLGYYGRARRMITLAQEVVKRYHGIFPDSFEELRKLPWIGDYTAQAILAFWYDKLVLAMDANLQKIFSRYYLWTRFGEKKILSGITEKLQNQIKKESLSGQDVNNALMDFGAFTAQKHPKDILNYPLDDCIWFKTGWVMEKKQKHLQRTPKSKKHAHYCLVFLHENHSKYWSSKRATYEPFLIEMKEKDDRKSIQDYFSAVYGLEVSVRPSFGWAHYDSLVTKLFHAQIQTGKPDFEVFERKDKKIWCQSCLVISGT